MGKYSKKNPRDNKIKETKEEAPKNQESSNVFDFDMDTNVFDKLNEGTRANSNKKYLSSWSYENIIKSENNVRQAKENKKKAELKIEDKVPQQEANKEPSEKKETKVDEEDFAMNDKFENDVYAKGMSFTNFNLSKLIIKGLSEMEFYTPTKVQEKVIPIVLKGHDVLVN